MKLDSQKIISKYFEYVKRKENKNEKPLSPEKWLWHVIDLLDIEDLLVEEEDLKFVDIKDMHKIIKKDIDDVKKSVDIKIGKIERCSFVGGPHMIVITGGYDIIWLEGPADAFRGNKEDYVEGKVIEIKAKNIGTINGSCDLGRLDNLPLYVADCVSIL